MAIAKIASWKASGSGPGANLAIGGNWRVLDVIQSSLGRPGVSPGDNIQVAIVSYASMQVSAGSEIIGIGSPAGDSPLAAVVDLRILDVRLNANSSTAVATYNIQVVLIYSCGVRIAGIAKRGSACPNTQAAITVDLGILLVILVGGARSQELLV